MSEQDEDVGELMIHGLEEVLAHIRGERPDLRTVRYQRRDDGILERVDTHNGQTTREIVHPRTGWDAAFQRIAEQGDDQPLHDTTALTSWDEEEWEWPEDE
jgi:hypothetical protein